MVIDTDRCWVWPGRLRKEDGRAASGRTFAYRLVYEAATGQPCPPGMAAHHLCENPACVNPWHLDLIPQGVHITEHGLPGDNHQAAKTSCPAGHPYDEENTYHMNGKHGRERGCRICRRENQRRWRAKQRK